MSRLPHHALLENNRRWVRERTAEDPEFFRRRAARHEPRYLWIGCSDARVPADVITGTEPGEMFVHRNIANQVVPGDANLLAVLQYAVEALGVQDVIVCGHEECGGVKAALGAAAPPAVDQWLMHVRTVARLHDEELQALPPGDARIVRLVELNVREQVYNLSRTPVVQRAWARGQTLRIHGLVYGLHEGLLRDTGVTMDGSPLIGSAPIGAPSGAPNALPGLRHRQVEELRAG
ncbi:carbonic anhydrase [Roseisolibacter agri]|uniref:carbonic anhydrase n=1 Tax=Roseisolibacter agri TaxID=2014610 RepID=UPI0024E09813|nr:carbonic anhydrase [Roseisolibacter agri]